MRSTGLKLFLRLPMFSKDLHSRWKRCLKQYSEPELNKKIHKKKCFPDVPLKHSSQIVMCKRFHTKRICCRVEGFGTRAQQAWCNSSKNCIVKYVFKQFVLKTNAAIASKEVSLSFLVIAGSQALGETTSFLHYKTFLDIWVAEPITLKAFRYTRTREDDGKTIDVIVFVGKMDWFLMMFLVISNLNFP